jgi:hypothetical protein
MTPLDLKTEGNMDLTPEEIERYAPYHTMPEFEEAYAAYSQGGNWNSPNYEGVAAQAYDRGAECAMRRAELRRMAELEREANGQFGVGA